MAENTVYTLAVYCFAAYGFFKVITFILKGSMDEGMSLLRKGREYYLEIKSWKIEKPVELTEGFIGRNALAPNAEPIEVSRTEGLTRVG